MHVPLLTLKRKSSRPVAESTNSVRTVCRNVGDEDAAARLIALLAVPLRSPALEAAVKEFGNTIAATGKTNEEAG